MEYPSSIFHSRTHMKSLFESLLLSGRREGRKVGGEE